MKKAELEMLTLPSGNKITGYKGECVFEDIRRHGTYYEKDMLDRWFLPHAGAIGCVYDIGGNLGNHTVYFATHSKAKVYSFEPVPTNFDLLKTNVEQNGLSERVKLFPFALGAQDGTAKMQVNDVNRGACRISNEGTQEVAVKRVDDLGLSPPDFVKIDVEGYELRVLKGMERMLRGASPVLWIEIFTDNADMPETCQFLASLGYFVSDFNLSSSNFVFTKADAEASKRLKVLCEFAVSLQQRANEEKKAFENRFSWKITAPLRAVRGLFGQGY